MTRHRVYILSAVLLFLLMGLLYSFFTPLWNPPDEELHFVYCQFIARNQSLPYPQAVKKGDHVSQAFHPPLYYLIGAPLCTTHGEPIQEVVEVNDGPGYSLIQHPKSETTLKVRAHLLRCVTLLLSTITLYVIYLMMRMIFPGEEMLALAASLFAGMNPQFMHVSASVSNEALAATFSTVYLFALFHYVRHKGRLLIALLLGTLLGGCLLSKTSMIFWIPVTACIIAWLQFRCARKLFLDLVTVFGTASLTAGWWYAKNWIVLSNVQTSQPWFTRRAPLSLSYLQEAFYNSFTSFFGYFGALQIPIASEYLMLYGTLFLLGCIGLFLLFIKRELQPFQQTLFIILLISLVGGMGIFILLNYKFYAFLGKYLFVVLAPIILCTITGLRCLLPQKWRNAFFTGISVLLILINVDTLLRIVRPAYADPALRACADQPLFSGPTALLNETSTVGQTFISSENNLCAIRIMFSSQAKRKKGMATFSLAQGGKNKKVLYSINLSHKKIKDNTRYFFIFPPLNNSKGKKYTFNFTSTSPPTKEGVALWYESHDSYPDGCILINGEPTNGDLYFTAYYFIGERPETEWQGKKQKIIRQGQYVNARELQLYYQRSKEFREKTITHEKILRFTKANRNRQSLAKDR